MEVDAKDLGMDRDLLMKILHAENILARRYFYPGCHQMQPYRSYFLNAGLLSPMDQKSERELNEIRLFGMIE